MPADPLRSLPKTKATFVEPMECLSVSQLPECSHWTWEIKLDGYRAVAVKSGAIILYSRNKKILNKRLPYIVEPLRGLPDGTVVDGEIGSPEVNFGKPPRGGSVVQLNEARAEWKRRHADPPLSDSF